MQEKLSKNLLLTQSIDKVLTEFAINDIIQSQHRKEKGRKGKRKNECKICKNYLFE